MKEFDNIVILTGAGVSAESGIDTFRDGGGLWEQHRVEDVATPEAFARDPDLVLRFYDVRREAIQTKVPNAAHDALARLDAEWPGELLIVTQNVDDLHERAGRQAADPYARRASERLVRGVRCAAARGPGRCSIVPPVRRAGSSAPCAPTSCGSARCRTGWTRFTPR